MSESDRESLATFGAGCFWCVEAVFQRIEGVVSVTPGYMGGSVDSPTYQQVCSGSTGHAEVAQVRFDPARVDFDTLLRWFWRSHDPTTENRQGADVGTQYRSAVFYHSPEQRQAAETLRDTLDASGAFPAPIVTEISEAGTFWPAEDYHHDYYERNGDAGYCQVVIRPKLEKLFPAEERD